MPKPTTATRLVAAAVLMTMLSSACSAADDSTESSHQPTVVTQPSESGPPGTLLDSDRISSVPGSRAWRIVYHSRDRSGADIAVTGQLVVPEGEPPPGGWPLVDWGHPTTGTADSCAPSWAGPTQLHLASEIVEEGWAMVATDYAGLGTEGPHPYLVGGSEAHAVLDAARAASQVEGGGIATDPPVVLAGFSQGGHAVLWAAQERSEYAPELSVLGVAVAAPVSDVTRFVERAEVRSEQFGVLVAVVYGFDAAYAELNVDDVLSPRALQLLPLTEEVCIGELVVAYTQPTEELLLASPRALEPWSRRLRANMAGTSQLGLPVLVVQGSEDPIVFPGITEELVDRLCGLGDPVEYVVKPHADHAVLSSGDVLPWLRARFAREAPGSDC